MPELNIKDKIIFITGANRGIGKAFPLKALELGKRKSMPARVMWTNWKTWSQPMTNA